MLISLVIANLVLTAVGTGFLAALCIDRRASYKSARKYFRTEFDRIYDAEIDNEYEIKHLKDKEK